MLEPIEYTQLKEEKFKRKFQKEIELKNINVVNPKTHTVHRQVKGLPLTVFRFLFFTLISK